MTWWQFSLNCQSSELEQVEDILLTSGALSLSLSDAGDNPIYEPLPGDTPVWDESVITATFEGSLDVEILHHQLLSLLPDHLASRIRRSELADQDWDQAYKEHLKPIQCASDMWIVPTWLEAPDPSATNISLDPGIAFGTGGHPTTALCLEWLAQNPPAGKTIIDYGCGSGILAIAACKLGAKQVTGVDIDPQALLASESNSQINNINGDKFQTCLPENFQAFQCDLLVANILAAPLVEFAVKFSRLVKSEGQILLSGILKTQLKEIQSAYEPYFDLDPARFKDDWISINGKRNPVNHV